MGHAEAPPAFLTDVTARFREYGIRVSIFVDPDPQWRPGAAECGADRVELYYTEAYARNYREDREAAIAPYVAAAEAAARRADWASTPVTTSTWRTSLFRRANPLDGRGVDRPCAHQRRSLHTDSENTVMALYRRCLK